jgi:hypothetical protein
MFSGAQRHHPQPAGPGANKRFLARDEITREADRERVNKPNRDLERAMRG